MVPDELPQAADVQEVTELVAVEAVPRDIVPLEDLPLAAVGCVEFQRAIEHAVEVIKFGLRTDYLEPVDANQLERRPDRVADADGRLTTPSQLRGALRNSR
jgi:hypothetical protein